MVRAGPQKSTKDPRLKCSRAEQRLFTINQTCKRTLMNLLVNVRARLDQDFYNIFCQRLSSCGGGKSGIVGNEIGSNARVCSYAKAGVQPRLRPRASGGTKSKRVFQTG